MPRITVKFKQIVEEQEKDWMEKYFYNMRGMSQLLPESNNSSKKTESLLYISRFF